MSSAQRFTTLVHTYKQTANRQLDELRALQKIALEGGHRDTQSLRDSISSYEKELNDGIRGILIVLAELDDYDLEAELDDIIEPIKQQISTLSKVTKSLPIFRSPESNLFEQDTEDVNPYEMESRRYLQETTLKDNEFRQLAEDIKERTEETAKIEKDMAELEKIFLELHRIVHEQHDVVDSIEDHVDNATEDVKRGNEMVKKAVKSKAAKAPIYAGVIGGLAVGGPVGMAAGSAIAGIAAGVGGLLAGIYTGKFFKKSATND